MTNWHGRQCSGPRNYSEKEYHEIVELLATRVGSSKGLSLDAISQLTGVSGRTVRQIVGDADGQEFLIAHTPEEWLFVAECLEDAEALTKKLESQIGSMQTRVDRRKLFEGLPAVQGKLFEQPT